MYRVTTRSSFPHFIYDKISSIALRYPFSSLVPATFHNFPKAKLSYASSKEPDPVAQTYKKIWISGLVDPKKTTMYARELLYAGKLEKMRNELKYEAKYIADLQIVYTYLTWKDIKVNIIDTDNNVDFTVSVKKTLIGIDGAILVLSSTTGVQSRCIQVSNFMEELKVPRFLLIDELHQKGANPWEVLKKARSMLGHNCAAIQIPIGLEWDFKGVVDLVQLKAYFLHGDTITIGEVPTDMEALVSDKRRELIETVSKVDDKFAIYSESNNNPSSADLEESVRRVTIAQKFIPIFMGGIFEKGPQTLLDGVLSYLPRSIEVSKYALDQNKKNMEANSLVQVARKNIVVRSTPMHLSEYTDIFSCSSAGGESHVYVLPVEHRTEASRSDAKEMVEYIRPQLLFLELDPFRSKSLEEDYSEFAVAFHAAKSIGNIEFDLGDLDEGIDLYSCQLKKFEELRRIYKETDESKLKKAAKGMVHIDVRDLIMTYRLFQHAKRYSSVLALVGWKHMFGMRHYWHIMKHKLSQDGILKEAERFEECMRVMRLDQCYQPPSWLDPNIRLWDR